MWQEALVLIDGNRVDFSSSKSLNRLIDQRNCVELLLDDKRALVFVSTTYD